MGESTHNYTYSQYSDDGPPALADDPEGSEDGELEDDLDDSESDHDKFSSWEDIYPIGRIVPEATVASAKHSNRVFIGHMKTLHTFGASG